MCEADEIQRHLRYDDDLLEIIRQARSLQNDPRPNYDARVSLLAQLERFVTRHRQELTTTH